MYVGAGLRVWSTIFGAERLPPSVIVRGMCAPSRVGPPRVRPGRIPVGSVWRTSLAGLCVAGLGGDLIYSFVVCLGWVWPLDCSSVAGALRWPPLFIVIVLREPPQVGLL